MSNRELEIIDLIQKNQPISSSQIFEQLTEKVSYATLKRTIAELQSENILEAKGKGKGTRYLISPSYFLVQEIDLDAYYQKEVDERKILDRFNFQIISDTLSNSEVFTLAEIDTLNNLQNSFKNNTSGLSKSIYQKELERLAIDLSWKSSQIEGNTYSLLETEKLLKERETASGKTKEEAIMLLNHKDAIDFIIEHPDYLFPLDARKIEDIHFILIKELGIERNLRTQRVGISGTNYRPLENEFQIREALHMTCELINSKKLVFEKALLVLVLISYIQPFMDGNKRTARIISNSVLIHSNYCPISFRTVDSIDYKKAMLLFYEQNNISALKKIFIDQFQFAVNTYF